MNGKKVESITMSSTQSTNFETTSMTRSNATKSTPSSSAMNEIVNCNSEYGHSHSEQPQTKRQKIENIKNAHTTTSASINTTITTTTTAALGVVAATAGTTTLTTNTTTTATQPDIIDPGEHLLKRHDNSSHFCSSLSSSANSISTPSSLNDSPTSTPSSSRTTSLSQLLNVQNFATNNNNNSTTTANILPTTVAHTDDCDGKEATCSNGTNSIITSTSMASTANNNTSNINNFNNATNAFLVSSDEVDRIMLPDLLSLAEVSANEQRGKLAVAVVGASTAAGDASSTARDMREFESSLTKQCLCGVSENTLRKPFQSHFSKDTNGQKRIANLNEWPTKKLMQFLSNLQLLFDIYLKQNSKGFICGRIMDMCDALIRNDNNLIDEIIGLANYNNAYVQFLASRVLAAFLVIAKQEMNDDWLKKLVDNLFNFEHLDHVAVQRIHFSLDIIKRIVEWKDIDLHPLEDEIVDPSEVNETVGIIAGDRPTTSLEFPQSSGYLHFPTQQPTLESNYFAMHFRSANDDDDDGSQRYASHASNVGGNNQQMLPLYQPLRTLSTSAYPDTEQLNADVVQTRLSHTASAVAVAAAIHDPNALLSGCHIVTLTDSESFDTTHLKCITIKILENKWPGLVKNMSALIANHLSIDNAEICILNFLELWENIISVKANLSIVETLPFYAQLEKLELLLNQHLSCTVYKQMLSLFNEALCYGSTLALQDMLPEETCLLAHQIVRHVKDYRILESLPRRQPENSVSFLGYKRPSIVYEDSTLHSASVLHSLPLPLPPPPPSQPMQYAQLASSPLAGNDIIEMDKTILQKMVLLVLKSIAVTVKEIRSDSSDSSIDSTDSDAYQDMVLIQRSIHDVLQKLESFIKNTLEFHPEGHFSKILIHLFDDQDDHLIEAMVCTLDVTAGITFRNNAFPELVSMLNPVYTFLEFLQMTSNSSDLLLDLLVSNETCFLLYLLRFLKYIRMNWEMFVTSCNEFSVNGNLDEAMSVLIRLRLQISRLVSRQLYPYDISPVLRLLESCESLYEGNELS